MASASGRVRVLWLLVLARGLTAFSSVTQDREGADTDDPIHVAIRENDLALVEQALREGSTLTVRDSLGYTPLHRAADDGYAPIVRLLLGKGAAKGFATTSVWVSMDGKAIDSRDHNSATPLLLAASGGHVECIDALVEAGANLQAADEFGLTALHYAAEGGHTDAIAALLAHGAMADAGDELGKTAFDVARAWGFKAATAMLHEALVAKGLAAPMPTEGGVDDATEPGSEPRAMKMPDNLQPEKMEL